MATSDPVSLAERLFALAPPDGSAIGNARLKKLLTEAVGRDVSEPEYESVRDELLRAGRLAKGKGLGGAVHRVEAAPSRDLVLEPENVLEQQEPPKAPRSSRSGRRPATTQGNTSTILGYRHDQRRMNNPEVGMVDPDSDPDSDKKQWKYDPHLDPSLQFDIGRAQIERYIDEALVSGDPGVMRDALETLKHLAEPYLTWTGKAERTSFDVDTVSLHVHERIDPATMLNGIRARLSKKGEVKAVQGDIFQAWFETPLPYREAIEFYKHDRGWANRLISGDSLLVMNSLLVKEGMAGQVQMIYMDPPYGIKYGSNFQAFVNRRDVKDGKDDDLTREPETIKAFRDTWELGVHSYLTYLRDRLLLARDLLADAGSVFIQISDDNLHHVREICDEVFGSSNFVSLITFSKTAGATVNLLPSTADYILWYAKDIRSAKFRSVYLDKTLGGEGAEKYDQALIESGARGPISEFDEVELAGARVFRLDNLTSQSEGRDKGLGAACWFPVDIQLESFLPSERNRWKTNEEGMRRLIAAGRVQPTSRSLSYVRFLSDFPAFAISNVWTDIGGIQSRSDPKIYVVQTAARAIERCMIMATDPGDVVLDPTCGSGTTSLVAEKWGRRWITCDTSRVAITLAKQRLMTASYDYYELKYPHEGLKAGFVYRSVPHVTLRSIANNPEVDEIWGRMRPAVEASLAQLNSDMKKQPPSEQFVILVGGRRGQTLDFKKGDAIEDWEVPFVFPDGWPASARPAFDAFHAARRAMYQQIDNSIAAHADQETLYDQPVVARTKLRVTGPFTVEAVPFPSVLALDETENPRDADAAIARAGESARQHGWRDELLKAGIRGKAGQMLRFAELETLPGTAHVHCSGTLSESGDRVVVSFGPQHAALEQRQVELAMREAGELFPRPKMIVFCAFAFDPEAAKDIDATKGITALKAQMNTDLLTEDLKKARSSNQSFWLMGQPDVEVKLRKDGKYEVEVNGFDYFDTAKGELISGGKGKIAAWSLDTDYDERSLFPRQVFFPMAGAKDGWQKLRKDIKAELDEELLTKLHGTVSLPFEKGRNAKIAVKIVDDRGIESLKVVPLQS